MIGVTLSYTIITPSFNLNYIKAIGGDSFDHCPFGNGGCGFSYHAVTTPDDAGFICDATLALDGDEDPGSYPGEELLVQAITGEEYLDRLVMSGRTNYRYTQKETLQCSLFVGPTEAAGVEWYDRMLESIGLPPPVLADLAALTDAAHGDGAGLLPGRQRGGAGARPSWGPLHR